MAIFTQARRRGQMLSNRRRNATGGAGVTNPPIPRPGQTPPIIPGQTTPPRPIPTGANAQGYDPIHYGMNNQRIGYAKVGQARNQGVTTPAGTATTATNPLPTLNANQRELIQALPEFGHNAFDPDALRRLMRQGLAAGMGNGAVNRFANPAFLRAAADPYGGASLLKGLTPDQLRALSQASKGMTGQFGQVGNNQDAIFAALPELQQQYAAQANVYKQAPDLTNAMSTTPPHAQLGSDGKYHDINQPLPPGVTLDPPEGATAPLTQDPSMIAEAAHGTPQAALNAGKDPTKHLAYWEDKGWTYNPATDSWTNRNGGGAATTPTPTPVPAQAGAAAATMPLDPAYIAAQRAAQYQLNSTLQGTYPALEQINAQNQLAQARMQTNQGVDTQALMEALSARGALQSSIYGTERGNLATNYMRTGQDLAADVANAQSSVYQQQQGAYNDYYASLIEALLSSAANSATSEYTPVGNANRGRNGRGRGRGRGRGNNRGGR